jgi:hypothetical protein
MALHFTLVGDSELSVHFDIDGLCGLRAYQDAGGSWFVEGDTNGDGAADLVIEVVTQAPLGADHVLL